MRLRRLALTDVAGVSAAELVVPERGVSVVLAPNETGKSTLLRAFRLLLDPKVGHNAKRADVKALQPVGRDVGSTVEAELVIGDETFEVSRTYNRRIGSSLTVHGRGTVNVTGKEADDLLRSRFLGAVDQDLFELLMFEQGRALDALAGAASATVMTALNEREAGAAPSGGGDGVIDAIRTRVSKAFHARNGTLIGPLRKLEEEVDEADAHRDRVERQIATLTGGPDESDPATEIAALRAELADIARRIERAGAAAKAVTARKLLDAAKEQVNQRGLLVTQLEKLVADEKQAAERVAATRTRLEALDKELASLERAAQAAGKKRETLLADAAQAEANLIAGLERTIEYISAGLKKEKVDEKLVKRAQKLDREVEVAQRSLESGSWELTAKAGRPLTLEVDGEPAELKKGAKLTRAVSASLVLKDPDGTVLDLHADADRRKAVEKLAASSAALADLLAGVDAADLDALEERLAARAEDEDRVEELRGTIEALREEPVTEVLPEPDPKALGPSKGSATAPDLDALESAHEEAIERLEATGGTDDRALADTRTAREQAVQLLAQQEEELGRSTERRAETEQQLTLARSERADEALDEEVTRATAALEAIGEVDDAEDVPALEVLQKRCSAELEEVQRRAHMAEGRRSSVGALTATLENLEENATAKRTRFERDLREAEAARTLLERLETAREAQGDRYREPLEQRIRELLTELYGYDCRVELDDDLRIVQRSEPDGSMVPWDQLSGGAKEQAGIVTGLAIAELAGDGGVPFWIDDAIVFTDDDRIEGLKALLAATTAQIIVLTCRSELADGLPAATFTTRNG
jgi:energy-coupling factor transporter ATP-binding protein EcfA2